MGLGTGRAVALTRYSNAQSMKELTFDLTRLLTYLSYHLKLYMAESMTGFSADCSNPGNARPEGQVILAVEMEPRCHAIDQMNFPD
jgi:hypothetical protein